MKKITLTLLALVCAFCCAFGLVACNNDDDNSIPKPYEISKSEWESTITPMAFSVYTYSELTNEGALHSLIYNGNIYQAYYIGQDYLEYAKQTNGTTTNYVKLNPSELNEWEQEPITAEEYNGHVEAYIELIDYISKNYEKFTFTEEEFLGYSCNIEELENQTIKVSSLNATSVFVSRSNEKNSYTEIDDVMITINLEQNLYYSISFEPKTLPYYYINAFNSLTNYTLKGGPSTTDADYAEYYYNESGFRMYTPNNAEPTRRELFYKYNSDTDNYTQYTKQADGTYTITTASKNTVETVIAGVHDTYMYFETQQNSFYKTADGMKNKTEITKTVGRNVHHYYDIDVKTDENGKIKSITWKYKMTQGEQSTQEYNMELTAGNTTIEFPNA